MLKKPRLAILGSGAGFSGLMYGLRKFELDEYEIDHFLFNRNLPVIIKNDQNHTTLPSSIPYGGLGLWGGVVAFDSYEEYLNSYIWEFLKRKAPAPANEINDIILASVNTKNFLECFKENQNIVFSNSQYNILKKNISMFNKKNNYIYLYDENEKLIDRKYDKVIICLGSIQTPRLVHASGYLDKKLNLCDNTMKLISKPTKSELEGIYDYSNKQPQFVKNIIEDGINHHYVKVSNYYKFNSAKTFNKAYWIASGKSHFHKLYAGIKILLPSMTSKKFFFTRSLQENVFKVESSNSASISLEFDKKISNIIWKSKDKLSVSAFHFHNSIGLDTEDELEKMNIIVSDSSVIRNLNGMNPLAKIFNNSFAKAMKIIS